MVMDGTKTKQDDKTSAGQQGTSTTTYTEEQVAERERNARSNALADAGRFKAEAEKALKAAQAAQERIARMEQDRIDAELETYKDAPAEIKRIRAEQKAKQLEADLAKERESKTEYETRIKAYETEKAELTKTSISGEVAKRLNVDAEKLVNLAKLTDGSQQAIEAIASAMPKASKNNLRPDSNRSLGGMMTWEQIQSDYIKNPYAPGVKERYMEAKTQRR